MVAGKETVFFNHRDHCTKPSLRSDMDPNVPEHLLIKTLVRIWYNNNIID
jgi:hypothetical protein